MPFMYDKYLSFVLQWFSHGLRSNTLETDKLLTKQVKYNRTLMIYSSHDLIL